MNDNSKVITILCSHLCVGEDIYPLTSNEWSIVAKRLLKHEMQPQDILKISDEDMKMKLDFSDEDILRVKRLLDRAGSLAFEIEKYANIGINIITRADYTYPSILKRKLGSKCPPIFYAAGNLNICNTQSIGFVGSRNIGDEEILNTKTLVEHAVDKSYTIVSGGARGVDQTSVNCAVTKGGKIILYAADSMLRKLKEKELLKAVRNEKAVVLSVAVPEAGFNTGFAMMRNKYIYAQSKGTIIIKSDYNKGGTWAGATEALKNSWCNVCCISEPRYKGNIELIRLGAIPIDSSWDFTFDETATVPSARELRRKPTENCQLSIFDSLNVG